MAEIAELAELASDLANAGRTVKGTVSELVLDTGTQIAGTMKDLVPVASGETRDTIDVFEAGSDRKAGPGSTDIEVGPTTWWAHLPERGTSNMAPQPYAGPAFDRHVPEFLKDVLEVASDDALW